MAAGARPARAVGDGAVGGLAPGDGGGPAAVWWPWLLVAAAVVWNLVSLRTETVAVAYLNDSSLDEQMVGFATVQLRSRHQPLSACEIPRYKYAGLCDIGV